MLFAALALGALLALLVRRLYLQAFERPPNFPPGPPRLPVWGSYWLVLLENYRFTHKGLLALARRYGAPVIGLHLGAFPAVVASSMAAVREVFTRPDFALRPDIVQVRARAFGERLGIFFSDGKPWVEQRRFMLRNMRDYGFGRRFQSMEETLRLEAEDLMALGRGEWADEVAMRDGCMHFPTALYPGFINLLWTMMSGQRFPRERYGLVREMAAAAALFVQSVDPLGGAVAQTPWLMHVAPEATGVPGVVRGSMRLSAEVKEVLSDHEASFSEDHLRDFIDRYILEMRRLGRGKEASFMEEQLLVVGADLLLAAATTTTTTLTLALTALLLHPHVLRRCQEELDAVVGRGRLPSLDDRASCPYMEAVLREVMRRATILPLALPHQAAEDTTFQGYSVPKHTLVFASIYGAHMDKEHWGDPENFRPERFLDEQGRLVKDVTMPFGAGKRLCPGETYSRQTMFVLFAALLQNFHLAPRDPAALPSLDDVKAGLAVTPRALWVRLTPRD